MKPSRAVLVALLATLALSAQASSDTPPATAPAATLDDPMRPPLGATPAPAAVPDSAAPAPSYALSAVKLDGPRSYAIINDTLVRSGDRVDGARVRKITRDAVAITTDSGVVTLHLNPLEIKRHVDSRQHSR